MKDPAVVDEIEALCAKLRPLTIRLAGPSTEHPGDVRWYNA